MNLNHLLAFVKVVQTRSFREAARQLHISQPAVTQRIQSLEEHLGTTLLQRDAEGIRPTSAGILVYDQAQKILKQWEEMVNAVRGKKIAGRLTLGASTAPSAYLLPSVIHGFHAKYPDVTVFLRVAGSGEVLGWLLDRKLDIAITGKPDPHPLLFSMPLFHDELQVIAPPGMDVSRIRSLPDLFRCDWILREPESDTRRTWEAEIIRQGYDPKELKVKAQLGSTEAILAAVEVGMGLSIVSSLAAKKAATQRRVQIVPLQEIRLMRTFYLSCLHENKAHPPIAAFLEFLSDRHAEALP